MGIEAADIAALREAAIKATQGERMLGIGSTYAYVQAAVDMRLGGRSWTKLCHLGMAGWRNKQSTIDDARFISLANPSTIIALIDQLKAESQQRDAFTAELRAKGVEMIKQRLLKQMDLAALADDDTVTVFECKQAIDHCSEELAANQAIQCQQAVRAALEMSMEGEQVPVVLPVSENFWSAVLDILYQSEQNHGNIQLGFSGGRALAEFLSEILPLRGAAIEAAGRIVSYDHFGDSNDLVFTAPQKPVISKEKLCDWLEDNFDIDDSQRDALAACFAQACDCEVRDNFILTASAGPSFNLDDALGDDNDKEGDHHDA